jgi:tricarballylate dehydrogenase
VVGAGSGGLAAALAAQEAGATVSVYEAGDRSDVGGNARYSGGLFLFTHDGSADVLPLLTEPVPRVVVEPYPPEAFARTLADMSGGAADPALVAALVGDSLPAMRWLHGCGVRFRLPSGVFGPYVREGTTVVPSGPALESADGGPGLVQDLYDEVLRRGIALHADSPVADLSWSDGRVRGVILGDGSVCAADAVVLASGGFEASAELRAKYLGPEWVRVKIRGTRHNTGVPLEAARDHGADVAGDMSACHSISVDAFAPNPPGHGVPTPPRMSRGFRFGIVVNADGERFFDEGADIWTRIYSKMGRAILNQPGAIAFHLFDDKVRDRVLGAIPGVAPIEGDTIEEVAAAVGIDGRALAEHVRAYNDGAAGNPAADFDRLDGNATRGLAPPKSNWAMPIDTPPFLLFAANCAVTFTHGGLRVDPQARVLDAGGVPVAGLYAVGEITGGLFFGNYPGGSSLMRSAVFGRRAGAAAASGFGSGRSGIDVHPAGRDAGPLTCDRQTDLFESTERSVRRLLASPRSRVATEGGGRVSEVGDQTDSSRRVLVTGGGSGIGEATARHLAEAGWQVEVADINPPAGGHYLDAADEAGWLALIDKVWPLDGLVNCAGIRDRTVLSDLTVEQLDRMLGIHIRGSFIAIREAARRWQDEQRGGSIVNIASVNATHAVAGQAHYVAAKAGVAGLTRATAVELAASNIRVNAIAPGLIRTPMTRERFADPEQLTWHLQRVPMRRNGEPHEIAAAVAFLLSDAASYITGVLLPVDGGWAAC